MTAIGVGAHLCVAVTLGFTQAAGDKQAAIIPWIDMSLTPGARLGPYEIISAIGGGGMVRPPRPATRACSASSR